MAAKLKTGDQVKVIAGRDKGATGVIRSVNPKLRSAIVAGVNVAVRHTRRSANSEGGRIPTEQPIDLSNLMLVDPENNATTRVGFRFEDGKKVRYSKKFGTVINGK